MAANETLSYHRSDQAWAKILLPDIYHGGRTADTRYGGLKGDLPIILGLVAFSIQQDQLVQWLPYMMVNSVWQARDLERSHGILHGRKSNLRLPRHRKLIFLQVFTKEALSSKYTPVRVWAWAPVLMV